MTFSYSRGNLVAGLGIGTLKKSNIDANPIDKTDNIILGSQYENRLLFFIPAMVFPNQGALARLQTKHL